MNYMDKVYKNAFDAFSTDYGKMIDHFNQIKGNPNKTKNFTLAKFHPDCLWEMEINSLLLYSILDAIVYLFRDVVITFKIYTFRISKETK